MRIELTFKKREQELYEFINERSRGMAKSGYIKQLIYNELNKERKEMENK
ncbi:MAG: hypothetical protein ACRCX2_35940 [Paraclostridium sp.]